MEETIKILENKSVLKTSSGAQTEIIRCEECEFPADCMNDLVYHMHEFHPLEENGQKMGCNFCSDRFGTKSDLMIHKKTAHPEKLQFCRNFIAGNCNYDNDCWFSHDSNLKQDLQEFSCNFCEKTFNIKKDFMKHKKLEHRENVQFCKNELTSSCPYSNQVCWFVHSINNDDKQHASIENNKTETMIQKLTDMIEKYSERVRKLEEMMQKK